MKTVTGAGLEQFDKNRDPRVIVRQSQQFVNMTASFGIAIWGISVFGEAKVLEIEGVRPRHIVPMASRKEKRIMEWQTPAGPVLVCHRGRQPRGELTMEDRLLTTWSILERL